MDFKVYLLAATCLSNVLCEIYHPNHNYDIVDASTKAPAPSLTRQTQQHKRENHPEERLPNVNHRDVSHNSGSRSKSPVRENIGREVEIMGRIRPHSQPLKRKRFGGPMRYSPHLKDSFGGYGDVKKYRNHPPRRNFYKGGNRGGGYKGGFSSNRPSFSKPMKHGAGFGYGGLKPNLNPKIRPLSNINLGNSALSFSSNQGPPNGFVSNNYDANGLGSASSEIGSVSSSESQSYPSYGGGGGGGEWKGDGDLAGRVKIKVFRGPTQKVGHKYFAPWGYYVSQPNDSYGKNGQEHHGYF